MSKDSDITWEEQLKRAKAASETVKARIAAEEAAQKAETEAALAAQAKLDLAWQMDIYNMLSDNCFKLTGERPAPFGSQTPHCRGCKKEMPEFGICKECEVKEERARLSECLSSHIAKMPKRVQNIFLDSDILPTLVKDHKAIEEAKSALSIFKGQDSIILLHGDTSVGKTTLAAAIYQTFLRQRIAIGVPLSAGRTLSKSVWTTAKEIVDANNMYIHKDDGYQISRIEEAELLVIDEFMQTKDQHDTLLGILQHRYDYCKRTIVTTGLTEKEVAEFCGNGIARKLFRDSIAIHVKRC